MARKLDEIQQEYYQLCAQLGELVYRQEQFPTLIEKTQARIKQLDEEAKQAARREEKHKNEQASTVAGSAIQDAGNGPQ